MRLRWNLASFLMAGAQITVRLDQQAINRELRGRSGMVGKVMGGFASITTFEIRRVFVERAGGVWWKVSSTVGESSRGVEMITIVQKSKAHTIVPRNAKNLNFFWTKRGVQVVTKKVNHPGSTPPAKLVLSGVERAGRRLSFARGTTITGTP